MKASVGDRIVIASSTQQHPARDGRIVEVHGPEGSPPYLVEWGDNGHQGLIFPGPDAHVQHFGADGQVTSPPAEPVVRKRTWAVDLAIVERDGQTTAHASLVGDGPLLNADGRAKRNPADDDAAVIGDEIAVARALRALSDRLLHAAGTDIGLLEHAMPIALAPR